MEKNWFIFKGDHHLGPFSSEDLVRMLGHDKAQADDLIWREGQADWLPLFKHPALQAFFEQPVKNQPIIRPKPILKDEFVLKAPVVEGPLEAPPALPPIPIIEDEAPVEERLGEMPPPLPPLPVVEVEPEPEVEELDIVVDLEPELPDVPEVEPEVEPEEELDIVVELEPEPEEEHDESSLDKITMPENIWEEAPTWQKASMLFSLVVGLLMSLYFFNWNGSDPSMTRFSGIANSKKRELQKVVNTNLKLGIKARLALSNTGNEIWLATNRTEEATVYLSLSSIKDRVLSRGKETIELRSMGELQKGGAKFRNIELVNGDKIAEGEYQAYIVGYTTGWKSRLALKLKEFEFAKNLKFVKNFHPEFKLSIPFFYSIKPISEFEKILGENKKKKKIDLAKPYQELIQRHKTFSSLLANIQSMYAKSLHKMNKGKDVQLFERSYAMEIEPILRDLLLDSNRKYIALINEDKRRSEDYLKLVDEGKQIGILISDIVVRTRKYGKLTNKKRQKLTGVFAPRIEEILKGSAEDTIRLEDEMKRVLAD